MQQYDTIPEMTLQEACNIAWHARVNGIDKLSPENIRGAFAVLEKVGEERLQLNRTGRAVAKKANR